MVVARKKFDSLYMFDLEQNLGEILSTIGSDEITGLFMEAYDALAAIEENEAGPAIKGKDPMSLVKLRDVFEKQIRKELSDVKFQDGQLSVGLMNRDNIGYGGSGNTPTGPVDTVDILAFYLEGVPDEHAFITIEQYETARKGSNRGDPTGRLGGGFMMTRKEYEREGWERMTGLTFAQVRHPISAQQSYKGFDDLISNLNMDKYIKLALTLTNRSLESK